MATAKQIDDNMAELARLGVIPARAPAPAPIASIAGGPPIDLGINEARGAAPAPTLPASPALERTAAGERMPGPMAGIPGTASGASSPRVDPAALASIPFDLSPGGARQGKVPTIQATPSATAIAREQSAAIANATPDAATLSGGTALDLGVNAAHHGVGGAPVIHASTELERIARAQQAADDAGRANAKAAKAAFLAGESPAQQAEPTILEATAAPGVPVPQYVAARFDNSHVPIRQGTIEGFQQAQKDEATAVAAGAKAKMDESVIVANAMGEEAARAERATAERANTELARQKIVSGHQVQLQNAIDIAARSQVDPNHWFDSRSTLQKIAATAAVAFSGATGGKGGAEMINQQIAADIHAQEANADLRQKNIAARTTALDALRTQFGDARQASIALEMSQREVAIQKMQALAAKSQSPIIKANADAAIAQLRESQAQTQMQFDKMAYVAAHMVGGNAGGTINQDRIVTTPDGRKIVARSNEEGIALRNRVGAVQNIQDNINKALSIRKSASLIDLANPLSTAHKQLSQLQAETAVLATVARGQGAMSKGDQAVADEAIGSMTGWLSNNDDVLRATHIRWGEQFNREVAGTGAEEVATGYGIDNRGQVAPKASFLGEAVKPRAEMPTGFVPDTGGAK